MSKIKRKPLYPVFIVAKGKHVDNKYLARNVEEKREVALLILDNWKNSGYLFKLNSPKTLEEYVKKETDISLKELQELAGNKKTANLKLTLKHHQGTPQFIIDSLTKTYASEQNHNKIIDQALDCIKKKNTNLSWQLMDYLGGGEYMEVEVSTFDNVKY